MKRYWLMLCLLLLCGLSGAEEPLVFDSPAQEARFKALTEETRCLVCQNQSIADSNVPLAQDLRREVFLMLQAGQDDATIKNFLVERYGDFVLYRPPVRGNTLLLWLAPLLLLIGGAAVLAVTIKKRQVMLAADALASAREEAEPETRNPAP